MAVSESFLTFVLEQLAGLKHVTARRMFGGVGFYAGDTFFAVADNDTLYFKVDETNVGDYTRRGMRPFAPYDDKSITMKYYAVPVSVLEDPADLVRWARKAVAVGETAAMRRPPRTRSSGGGRRPRRTGGTPCGRRR